MKHGMLVMGSPTNKVAITDSVVSPSHKDTVIIYSFLKEFLSVISFETNLFWVQFMLEQ